MSSTHTDEMSDCISATSVHDLVTPEKATTTTTTTVIPQSSLEVSPLHPRLVTHGRRPAHGTQSRTTTTATTLSNNNNSRSSITTSKSLAGSRSHNNGPSLTTSPAGQLTEDELRAVQEYTRTEAEQPTTTPGAPATTLKSRWRGLLASVVAVEDSIVRHLSSSPPAPSAARELAGPRRSSSHVIASEIITQITTAAAALDSEKSHDDTNREVENVTNGFSPAPTQPQVPLVQQQQPATSDTVNVEATAKGTAGRHRRNPRRRGQSAIDATAHATTMTLINDVAAEAAIRRPASGTLSSFTGSNNGATHPPTFIVRNTRSSSLRSGLTHPTVTTNTATSPIPTAKRMYTPVHETETTLTATTRTTITTATESGQSPVQRGRSQHHHDDPYAHVHSVVRDYRTNQIDQLAAAYRAARVSGSVLQGRPSSAEELLLLSPPPRRVPGAHSLEPGLTTPQSQIQPHYYNSNYIHNNNNINVQSSSAQRHGSRRRSQPSSHHPPSRDAGTEASMIEVSRSTSAGEANSRTVEEDEEEEEEETARTLTMTQTAGVAVKDVSVAAAVPEKLSDVEDTSSSNRKRAVSFHEDHHYTTTKPVEEDTPRPLARRLTSNHEGHPQTPRTRSRATTRTMSASVTPRRRLTAAEQAELYVQEQMQLRRQRQPSPYRANVPVPTPWRPSSPRPAEQRKWQREVVKAGQHETRRQMSRTVTTPRYQTPSHNRQQVKQEGKVVVRAHSASLVPRCASIIPARYRTSSRPLTKGNRTLSAADKTAGSAEAFRGRAPFTVSPLPREGRVNHHRSPPRVRAEPVLINTSKQQQQQQQTKEMFNADTEAVKGNKYNGGRRPSAFASIPPPPPPPTNSDTSVLLAEGYNKGVARPLLSPPHAGPVERGTLRKDKTANKASARSQQVDMSSFQSRLLFALNPPSLVTSTR